MSLDKIIRPHVTPDIFPPKSRSNGVTTGSAGTVTVVFGQKGGTVKILTVHNNADSTVYNIKKPKEQTY